MKLKIFWVIVGLGTIAIMILSLHKANSAPLPAGFPPPTADNTIEVKVYPAYRAATIRLTGNLARATNRAFNPLFEHISSNDISMTAPVEARYPAATLATAGSIETITQGEAIVAFLYRNPNIQPSQVSSNIIIEDFPPITVVSLGRRGSYNYSSYQQALSRLGEWLEQYPEYEIVGQPRRFFYDGPFIPDGIKRSEVQIPIELVN